VKAVNEVKAYVPDSAYLEGDESTYQSRSDEFRDEISEEYGLDFEGTNIGPGFDLPAFVASIPIGAYPVAGFLALFLAGKKIEENIDAWIKIGLRLSRFFHRKTRFNREGALLLAISTLAADIDPTPQSIELVGYEPICHGEHDLAHRRIENIADDIDPINLIQIVHVFNIKADGQVYVVLVDGSRCSIQKL